MTDRYKVVSGSTSGHCCFSATVVDTSKPCKYAEGEYESICECFENEDAERIVAAMNRSVAIES